MKTFLKIGTAALITISFAACGGKNKKGGSDSTAVKIDSTTTTVVDSNKIKADSIKKDTASSYADSTKKSK